VVYKRDAMKAYGGVDVKLHAFIISALDVDELPASRFGCFTLRKLNGYHSQSGHGGEENN
jgi:hypothetical protein